MCAGAANDRFPPNLWNEHVRFGLGAAVRRVLHQGQLCAVKATFAKSRERSKITARVGPARCDAASPKQTLIRCCSIIEVLRSAQRTKPTLAASTPMAAFSKFGSTNQAGFEINPVWLSSFYTHRSIGVALLY